MDGHIFSPNFDITFLRRVHSEGHHTESFCKPSYFLFLLNLPPNIVKITPLQKEIMYSRQHTGDELQLWNIAAMGRPLPFYQMVYSAGNRQHVSSHK